MKKSIGCSGALSTGKRGRIEKRIGRDIVKLRKGKRQQSKRFRKKKVPVKEHSGYSERCSIQGGSKQEGKVSDEMVS